ncbi:MAG: hypothetical protein OXG37_11405 [Actinomycetia bacterium]|nr:hypothetical protein [Actinomycetes bacterium]
MRRAALIVSLVVGVAALAAVLPVAASPVAPPVTVVHVPSGGERFEIVFIGGGTARPKDAPLSAPVDRQAFIRDELEKILAFVTERYGLEPPPVQVVVLLDYSFGTAMATRGTILMGASWYISASSVRETLAHEYGHVIDLALIGGDDFGSSDTRPWWFVEGHAEYFATLYARPDAAARRASLLRRSLGGERKALREYETPGRLPKDVYALGALAVEWLAAHAVTPGAFAPTGGEWVHQDDGAALEFARQIGRGVDWQIAFEAAFGLSPDAFYAAFERYHADSASALDADCTITGTAGDDILTGTPGDDIICGLAGDDIIRGRAGNDIIRGGPGDDTLRGGPGDDTLYGGAGNNDLDGGRGHDTLHLDGLDSYVTTDDDEIIS